MVGHQQLIIYFYIKFINFHLFIFIFVIKNKIILKINFFLFIFSQIYFIII